MGIDTCGTTKASHPKMVIWVWVLITWLNCNLTSAWEWSWADAYFGHTGIMGKNLLGMNLATVLIYDMPIQDSPQ